MVKISVVITVYNGEKYIRECLESVLGQTLTEIEVICVNDASRDRTADILEEYRLKDSRVQVITNSVNINAGRSRNAGMEKAKGKYIIFLDADDIFDYHMLEKAYEKADYCEADICIFREDLFEDGSYVKKKVPYVESILDKLGNQESFSPKEINEVIFNFGNGWAWDKIIKREFIIENGLRFQDIPTNNDAFFIHSAMVTAKKIAFLNETLVHHRINNKSSLSSKRDTSWESYFTYLKGLQTYLIKHSLYEIYERSFVNWAANYIYWDYSTLNESNRQKLYYSLKEHALKELGLFKYKIVDFYNPFYFWFFHVIHNVNNYSEADIPVSGTERWRYMILKNNLKIEEVFRYLQEHEYKAGVWGSGERGKIFLDLCGERIRIKKVFDNDIEKIGLKINNKYMIETFDKVSGKDIDVIFVTNVRFFDDILEKAKEIKPDIILFDLDSYLDPYLAFPIELKDCVSQ